MTGDNEFWIHQHIDDNRSPVSRWGHPGRAPPVKWPKTEPKRQDEEEKKNVSQEGSRAERENLESSGENQVKSVSIRRVVLNTKGWGWSRWGWNVSFDLNIGGLLKIVRRIVEWRVEVKQEMKWRQAVSCLLSRDNLVQVWLTGRLQQLGETWAYFIFLFKDQLSVSSMLMTKSQYWGRYRREGIELTPDEGVRIQREPQQMNRRALDRRYTSSIANKGEEMGTLADSKGFAQGSRRNFS